MELPSFAHFRVRSWFVAVIGSMVSVGLSESCREQDFNGLADEFLSGIAEECLDKPVNKNNRARLIRHDHATGGCFDDKPKPVLGAFPFRNVIKRDDRTTNLMLFIMKRGAGVFDGHGGSVLTPQDLRFDVPADSIPEGRGHGAFVFRINCPIRFGVMNHVMNGTADQFFRFVPQQACSGWIHKGGSTLQIQSKDAFSG